MENRTAAEALAGRIAALRADDLPAALRQAMEDLVLDVAGLCIAARGTDYVRAIIDSGESGGPCTIIGHTRTSDAGGAALANGTAAHGEDFDDTFEQGPVHTGAVIVPAVLAAAERYGRDGPAARLGIAVGVETMCRLSLVAPRLAHKAGFHATSVFGPLAAAAAVGATMGFTERRETGMLKRLRATPLPSWALVGGVILNSLVVALLLTVITVVVGIAAYDVHAPYHPLPLLLGLVLGAVAFCALGIGVSTVVRNAEAAPAVVQFPYFLLNFISGVFFPAPQTGFMHAAAQCFPVVHLVNLCFAGFDPRPGAGAVDLSDVLVLLAWGVVAIAVAVRRFRWEPRR